MKLYTIKIADRIVDWTGTQLDAKAKKAEQAAKHQGAPAPTWHEEEVPTDKPGLIEWLRANCTSKLGE